MTPIPPIAHDWQTVLGITGRRRGLAVFALILLLVASGAFHLASGNHLAHAHGQLDSISHAGGDHHCEIAEHAGVELEPPCVASTCPLCVPANAVVTTDPAPRFIASHSAIRQGINRHVFRLYRPPRALSA